MISKVGMFFGKLVKEEEGLEGLKRGFEKFFGVLKDMGHEFEFLAEISGNKLITRSKCPMHRYFNFWCDKFCLRFAENFAKAFGENIRVKRIKKQPENDYCVFEFECPPLRLEQ